MSSHDAIISDECYEASNPSAIFVLVVQTPCMVACIGLTILFWYNYHYAQSDDLKSTTNVIKTSIAEKRTKDSKHIQKLGGVTLVFYCLFIVALFVSLILDVSMDCPDIGAWILPIVAASYIGGFVGVATLFTNRIIIAFENTKYQASPRLLTISKIIGVFVFVLLVGVSILRVTDLMSLAVGSGIMLFAVLLLFFYCLVLLRLFLIKLNSVINDFATKFGKLPKKQLISLTRSNSGSFDASKMIKNSDFNFESNTNENGKAEATVGAQDGTNAPYVTRLINDISELKIKYTLTVIIALISSVFFPLLAMIVVEIFKINGPFRLEGKVSTAIVSMDALVNCVCLFLQFDFSRNLYKTLCTCCHNKCQDRYTNEANKQLIQLGHGNMQLQRTKSKEIIFKSNNHNDETCVDKENNCKNKMDKHVDKTDIIYEQESNNDNLVGHKIINTLQA